MFSFHAGYLVVLLLPKLLISPGALCSYRSSIERHRNPGECTENDILQLNYDNFRTTASYVLQN